MPRAPCSRKTNGTQHACTYILLLIRTLIGTDLVCCLVQGGLRCALLCFAVLAVQRHTYSYMLRYCCLLLHTYRSRCLLQPKKQENKDSSCIKCSGTRMLALVNTACLLALLSSMHERENSAKHGTSRNSNAPDAGHDIARHRTAPRRAIEVAKLNRAGARVFLLLVICSWV